MRAPRHSVQYAAAEGDAGHPTRRTRTRASLRGSRRPAPPDPARRRPVPSTRRPHRRPSSFSAWLGVVLVVVLFSGGLFGYDQGVISGALDGHQIDLRAEPAHRRSRHQLGHVGRVARRARRRRTRGPDRPQAHGADRGRAVHAGRGGAGLCARKRRSSSPDGSSSAPASASRPSPRRSMRRSFRRRRGEAASSPPISSPSRSAYSLPISSMAGFPRTRLAAHAGRRGRAGSAALHRRFGRAGIAALVDENASARRRARSN